MNVPKKSGYNLPHLSDSKTFRDVVAMEKVGQQAALLSLTEIGLGGILHGFHIPFGGHFLSLNQGFLLSRFLYAHRTARRVCQSPIQISNCAALLKSLSPMGKKLTPMLAISMQGLLLSLTTSILGVNAVGICFGMLLISLWGFLQPLLLYYFLFGSNLVHAISKFTEAMNRFVSIDPNSLLFIFLLLVVLKAVFAIAIGFLAMRTTYDTSLKYEELLLKQAAAPSRKRALHPIRRTLREFLNPLFLLSLCLTAVFLFYSESSRTDFIFGLLRPAAFGAALFLGFQLVSFKKILAHFPNSLLSKTLQATLERASRA